MIAATELTKVFGVPPDEVRAVDAVSFEVNQAEVFGLLGPNGAGKTTTLRMILGLLPPTSGYAEVAGHRTSGAAEEVKRQIGLVSASSGMYPWLSPRETLLYFADLYGVSGSTAKTNLNNLIELLDLGAFIDRRCATLSTGQGQRVNLARALIHDPPVVLLDEPTRGLDVMGSKVVFDYIELLKTQGKSVIVSTHRLDEAQRLCDRFGLLHQGRMVQQGTLDDLRRAVGESNLVDMFLSLVKGQGSVAVASSVEPEAGGTT